VSQSRVVSLGRGDENEVLRSVSIELMWAGRPYPERARAAAEAGFDLVDLWDARTSDVSRVAAVCRDAGTGINGFFGNRDHSLCDPAQRGAVYDEVGRSLDTALSVGARQLHLFSNAIRPGGVVVPSPPLPQEALHDSCLAALADLAALAGGSGVTLVLEALNPVFLPGYLWSEVGAPALLVHQLAAPEVRLVFDAFHQQLSGGRLTDHLVAALPWLARFDVAEVPGRHEPGHGEIDFAHLRSVLDNHGWDGTVCFEVVPSDGSPETAVKAIDQVFPKAWCRAPRRGAPPGRAQGGGP
jgi:hydroxypyruvate isomerase